MEEGNRKKNSRERGRENEVCGGKEKRKVEIREKERSVCVYMKMNGGNKN